MKVVILAGGVGTRLSEETETRPKPMIEIGGRPILWHIMKLYAHFGHAEFFVTLGYKGELVKRWFRDQFDLEGSMSIDLGRQTIDRHDPTPEPWIVHLIDTGLDTQTGGRIKRLEPWLKDTTFMATYGDGVGDADLTAVVEFHRAHGRLATVTAVRPPARFGGLVVEDGLVTTFSEKPQVTEGWINGGFLVLEPGVLDYIEDDETIFESDVLEHLAEEGQLAAFTHNGFWQCMDTLRDKRLLEALWAEGRAPWRLWD